MSFIHTYLHSTITRLFSRVMLLNVKAIMLCMMLCVSSAYTSSSMANEGVLSRAQAVEIAKQRSGDNARVLSVKETQDKNGGLVYAVKIIKNGRVKVYRIPAKPKG